MDSLPTEVMQFNTHSSLKGYSIYSKVLLLWIQKSTTPCTYKMQFFKPGPLSQKILLIPLCRCESIRDTQHSLFSLQIVPRSVFASQFGIVKLCVTYQIPSLNLLLFGSTTLSLETNIGIFEEVHKYIIEPKRLTYLRTTHR